MRKYERPSMILESFSPQVVCANCSFDVDITFDCMAGNQKDTSNVLSAAAGIAGCENNAGFVEDYNGTATAVNSSNFSSDHTKYNSHLSWDNSSRSATASNCSGMLYICYVPGSGFTTGHWSNTASGTITHSSRTNVEHVQIAPVFGDPASVATSY